MIIISYASFEFGSQTTFILKYRIVKPVDTYIGGQLIRNTNIFFLYSLYSAFNQTISKHSI